MNNQNIFQKRASERKSDKFSNLFGDQSSNTLQLEDSSDQNIFQKHAQKNKEKEANKFGFWETAKDVGQQVLSQGAAGIGGAYGNILDSFGLQNKEGQTLPGEQARNSVEFQILDKIERGETPTANELLFLSGDSDVPTYTRLPTSKEVQNAIGVGEGKTPAGRIAGHGAKAIGEGIVTGSGLKGLIGLGASNVAGQGIREAGGPEALATATEILGPLATSAIQKSLNPSTLTKSGQEANKLVQAGRKIGLAEEQITPLLQGEKKVATLSKIARKGTKTKERFASIKERLGDSYNTIKSSPEAKKALPNNDQISLTKAFSDIRNDLSKTLAPSPDKQAALDYIENSLKTLRNTNVTPEYLVNFWQDINKSVKWNSINGGKKALAQLKEPVSKVLKKVSPSLAEDFELTNQLYSKYAQISKKLKPDLIDSIWNKSEIVSALPAGFAFAQGNPYALAGLAGEGTLRILAREMLINPYFQNIGTKLVTNLNQGSGIAVTRLVKQAQEFLERKHPKTDWSFLSEGMQD